MGTYTDQDVVLAEQLDHIESRSDQNVADSCFEIVASDHRSEYGYSSSLRSYGATYAPMASRRAAQEQADRLEAKDLSSAVVIPFASAEDVTTTTGKLSVKVTAEQAAMSNYQLIELFTAEIAAKGGYAAKVAERPKPNAPRASATGGKLTTRYFLVEGPRGLRLDGTYSSAAEARTSGIEIMKGGARYDDLRVRSEQVRVTEDGEANQDLIAIVRPHRSGTVVFEFSQDTIRKGAKPNGYVVAYSYHS